MADRDGAEPATRSSGLVASFTSLAGAQVIATAAGFVFWLLAARTVAPAQLGVAAAAIAACALLSKLLTVGLGTLLIVELPGRPPDSARHLLRVAVVALALLGAVGAGGFALVLALLAGDREDPLTQAMVSPALAGWFVALVAATTVATVLDQAVLGVGRAAVQVTRNTTASLGRYPLLVALALIGDLDAAGLLACWVIALVLSLLHTAHQLGLLRRITGHDERSALGLLARYWRSALSHHALNLALAGGPLIVPVIAGATLTAVANAHFSIAWMVATFLFIPPYMLATALFASSAGQGIDRFATSMRTTLPLAFGLSLGLCVAIWLGGGLLLRMFGQEYAADSVGLLRLLALAGLWMVVKDHLVALFRVQGRLGFATRLALGAIALEAGGALAGAWWGGSEGLVIGWLLAAVLQALLIAPLVVRTVLLAVRAEPAADQPDPDARPVLVSNGLVAHPVEGTQVVARQLADHVVTAHGARVLVPPGSEPVPSLAAERGYTRGWIPWRGMLAVARQRPSAVVLIPDGGIDYRKVLHAWLLGLAGRRRAQVVVMQRHRDLPRWVVRIVGGRVRVVAGSEADRRAIAATGFETTLLTPAVDPARVSDLDRARAREALGLPPDARVYLHVGHARLGRNLTSLAPLAAGDSRLVLVISPFSAIEAGALPAGAGLVVVHEKVDVAPYYRAADVYLFPTHDRSHVIAFPMSIAEALANRRPVVARRSPMTERWATDPRVHLVDTDSELLEAARAVEPGATPHAPAGDAALPLVTCTAGCRLDPAPAVS